MNQTKNIKKASQGAKRNKRDIKALLTYKAYVKMHVSVLLKANNDESELVEKFIFLLKQIRLDLIDVTRFDEYIVKLMDLREKFDKRRFRVLLRSFYSNFVTCELIKTLTPIVSIEPQA
jgi:hypothetical protein